MQTSGTGRKTDASYHLEKKITALVNRQGGFEGVSTLATPQPLSVHMNFNLLKMGSNSNRLFSHCFRKKKNQQLRRNSSC